MNQFTQDHFEIKKSSIKAAGKGLFSKVLIKADDHIGYYTGKIITDKMSERKPYIDSLYLVYVCKDHWIYGEGKESNYTRFINHDSKRPNARLVTSSRWKTARIVAEKRIRPGEEIFFDYGEDYWEVLGIDPH